MGLVDADEDVRVARPQTGFFIGIAAAAVTSPPRVDRVHAVSLDAANCESLDCADLALDLKQL